MKKLMSVLLALTLVLALCACGGNTNATTPSGNDETTAPIETTEHIHDFIADTCEEPGVCECGETQPAAGHIFSDATCSSPMICLVCDAVEGDALDHVYSDATCIEPASCINCGESLGILAGHAYENGQCAVCGEIDPSYDIIDDPVE